MQTAASHADPELAARFEATGLDFEVCKRCIDELGVKSVSDLRFLDSTDISKLQLKPVESKKLGELVNNVNLNASKGKVPLPHAQLQGDCDSTNPRFALVMGNNRYTHFGPLATCENDARAMASELGKLGFTVTALLSQGKSDADAAIQAFINMLPTSPCEVCVHFSGHGLEIDGENFLVPVDASSSASKEAIKQECISLQYLLDSFCAKLAEKVLLIFLLDCCRENPTKSIKFKSSFAKLDFSSPLRMFVGFATAPGQLAVAKDPKIPNLSPFTYAIVDSLANISISSSNIDIFMQSVRGLVEDVTSGKQSPFHETNFRQNFRFRRSGSDDQMELA